MTRETRIGLLVGLMFIVMFGVVLSEFTGKPAAAVGSAKPAGEKINAWSPTIPEIRGEQSADVGLAAIRQPPGSAEMIPVDAAPKPAAEIPLVAAEIIKSPAAEESASAQQQPKAQIYKVQPKDSLMKIARKVYGPEYEYEYKRILDANRDKLKDEKSSLVVGIELSIPPLPQAKPAVPTVPARGSEGVRTASAGSMDAVLAAAGVDPAVTSDRTLPGGVPMKAPVADLADLPRGETVGSSPKAATADSAAKRKYVVKKGDSLYKIARETLKNDSKANIDKIVSANKGKLHDPHDLAVGMELSIPG